MSRETQEAAPARVVVILDPMEMRRSGIVSLLGDWAESARVKLVAVGLDDIDALVETQTEISLIIFNAGGDPIADPDTMKFLEHLRTTASQIPLVVMSDHLGVEDVAVALHIGAMGFVHTGSILDLAVRALSFILNGGSYFPVTALRDLRGLTTFQPGSTGNGRGSFTGSGVPKARPTKFDDADVAAACCDDKPYPLTPRQAAVLECLCQGDSNKLIARRLGVSETTVKVHVRQIMRKLGAANRTHAAVLTCNSQSVAA